MEWEHWSSHFPTPGSSFSFFIIVLHSFLLLSALVYSESQILGTIVTAMYSDIQYNAHIADNPTLMYFVFTLLYKLFPQ